MAHCGMASLRQRTLQSALAKLGEPRRLARRLRVPVEDLRNWLQGRDEPPTAVFLEAVDIVADVEPLYSERSVKVERRARPRGRSPAQAEA